MSNEESLWIHLLYCTENDQCSVTEMKEDDDLTKFAANIVVQAGQVRGIYKDTFGTNKCMS